MRIIAKSSLKNFWNRPGCSDARGPLHSWYDEAVKAAWRSPQDVKDQYANASICGNNRVVFNVAGNKGCGNCQCPVFGGAGGMQC